jgi:hypothetical protein
MAVSLVWMLLPGCASQPDARYVYQDGQFGVIGIPQNSPFGQKNYREQAEAMMSRHFPDGYEVVRAEEVVEGQRMLDTLKTSELDTEPSVSAWNQIVKLGKLARSMSLQQKDTIPILECRIIYKRKTPDTPAGANGFAALASTVPPFYIDPNDVSRCHAKQLIAATNKNAKTGDPALTSQSGGAKQSDPAAKPASHESEK